METARCLVAALELLLILPAALFMSALVARNLQPLPEPANIADQIVMWYAGRIWALWVLLLVLPLTVLITGSATLLLGWNHDRQLPKATRQSVRVIHKDPATLLVAATTLTGAGTLVVVVLHMLAN